MTVKNNFKIINSFFFFFIIISSFLFLFFYLFFLILQKSFSKKKKIFFTEWEFQLLFMKMKMNSVQYIIINYKYIFNI